MREFSFCSEIKDKLGQTIHLNDVVIWGQGKSGGAVCSPIKFGIVTSLTSYGGDPEYADYVVISDDLTTCGRTSNNGRISYCLLKAPAEWSDYFANVKMDFNKRTFGKEFPTQEEIDEHYREEEFDAYQKVNKIGKYAPAPIDRELWKKRMKQLSQKLVEEKPLWNTIFSNELNDDEIKALWVSPEFGRLGDRFIKVIKLNFPKCEKTFEDNKEDMNNYLFGLFKEIVYDWTTV